MDLRRIVGNNQARSKAPTKGKSGGETEAEEKASDQAGQTGVPFTSEVWR